MTAPATALVVAPAPGPDGPLPGLARRLDRKGRERLAAALLARVRQWAQAVAGDQVVVEMTGPGPGPVAAAVERVFAAHPGPLLVVAPDAPRLSPVHARVACLDLDEGARASIGTTHDGRWYLLALAGPVPELFAVPDPDWESPLRLSRMLEAAAQVPLEVGLLRMERAVRSEQDADALLADPMLPGDIRAALQPVR